MPQGLPPSRRGAAVPWRSCRHRRSGRPMGAQGRIG